MIFSSYRNVESNTGYIAIPDSFRHIYVAINYTMMEILNKEALTRGRKRRADALSIIESGVNAVMPDNIIRNTVRLENETLTVMGHSYDLAGYEHVYVAGGGKASGAMAAELENILGNRITAGIVNDRYESQVTTRIIRVNHAGHPLPTDDGIQGVKDMLSMLSTAGKKDLIIFLISGGGSALLPFPAPGISLEDIIKLTDILLKSGARIDEINTIRKHVSQIKGGGFLRATGGADVLSLIFSDVIGDDISYIASGPTAPDDTTYQDAINILIKYGIFDRVPSSIIKHLEKGAHNEAPETLKSDDPVFQHVTNLVIASNLIALKASAGKSIELGYTPLVLGSRITGESREVALVHAGIAAECLKSGIPVAVPAAIISGGETTVTVRGNGKGGRNQEFVLGFLQDYQPGITIVSMDTDGIDGVTDACGAIADDDTISRAGSMQLSIASSLKNNSSYDFFNSLGDLMFTGPTGTNVSDLRVILVYDTK